MITLGFACAGVYFGDFIVFVMGCADFAYFDLRWIGCFRLLITF